MLALAILVGFGTAITMDASISGLRQPTPQMAVLAIIFNALAALTTPLTSAAGGGTYMPIGGETLYPGLIPLAAWSVAGLGCGLLVGDAKRAIPATLTISGLSYLFWILSSLMVLPTVKSMVPWELYLARASSQIFIEAPLDFAAIFAIPAASSIAIALFEPIPPTSKPTNQPIQPVRRRFWEYEE